MTRQARAFLLVLVLLQTLLLTTAARPPLAPAALPVVTGDPVLDRAERVALAVLSANQTEIGHRAAPFYKGLWIRDSYAWGMVPDDSGTLSTYARGELRYWLAHQQPSGGWITFEYSGWYDETPIMIAAVLDAYRLTGDVGLVRRALPALRRAWGWMHGAYVDRRHGSDCLLWASLRPTGQHWAADWADQVSRQGYTPQLEGLWYRATHAMAAMELLAGGRKASKAADTYARAASCIAYDANTKLWRVAAPAHRDAPPLASFGHYGAVPAPAGRDYFEVDANALLVAAGVATPRRRGSVLAAVTGQARYLLGGDGGGPARVLYGDYAPEDYGAIHNWMAPGRYQSAYWPTVGGLLAIAAARNDAIGTSAAVLDGLAARGANNATGFNEWYTADGTPGGASLYGWGARMYLLALYRAYLGVDDSGSIGHPADLVLRAAPGSGRGALVRLGHHITVVGHGSGRFRYARLDGHTIRSFIISARYLHEGSVLDVYRG